jgi:hypothetical protein
MFRGQYVYFYKNYATVFLPFARGKVWNSISSFKKAMSYEQ